MVLLTLDQLLGRLHPLVVHLPIGMLLLAVIFWWLSGRERYRVLQAAVPVSLLLGTGAAVLASLTGLLLSRSGDYAPGPLNIHKWMGLALTLAGAGAYLLKSTSLQAPPSGVLHRLAPLTLLVLLIVTGHLGGNLTHGSDYLMEPLAGLLGKEQAQTKKKVVDIGEASVYHDIVAPLLEANCYGCHGPEKQKGKLRLDDPEGIRKGGKSGAPAVVAGRPAESEMMRRVYLPKGEKKHMPPKEKRQLTAAEISLLEWWIEAGAGTEDKVGDLEASEAVRSYLASLGAGLNNVESPAAGPGLPAVDLPAPDPAAIRELQAGGVVVLPVGKGSRLLSVNFVNAGGREQIRQLEPLASHITWLKLSQAPVTDSALATISGFPHLTRLYLDHTRVSDRGLTYLRKLKNLTYLNLVGTPVSAAGIAQLQDMPALRELFLHQTSVSAADWPRLTALLEGVQLDSGGYQVPTLVTDTTLVVAQ